MSLIPHVESIGLIGQRWELGIPWGGASLDYGTLDSEIKDASWRLQFHLVWFLNPATWFLTLKLIDGYISRLIARGHQIEKRFLSTASLLLPISFAATIHFTPWAQAVEQYLLTQANVHLITLFSLGLWTSALLLLGLLWWGWHKAGGRICGLHALLFTAACLSSKLLRDTVALVF